MLRHSTKQRKSAKKTITTKCSKALYGKKEQKLKPKRKKAVWKPPSEALLTGAKPAPEPLYLPDPTPADNEFPATPSHMPSYYIGYKFNKRLNEFQVDQLSPLHRKFSIKTTDGTNRFAFIGYQRTKPWVVKAYPRELGTAAILRSKGFIPCAVQHVKNGKDQHMNFYIDPVTLEKYKTMKAAWAVEWHLEVDGHQERIRALLRDWQIDPVTQLTGSMRFIGTSPTHPTHIHLPVEFEGADDGNAAKKGAMMLTPQTNIQGYFYPSIASRLGTGAAPYEINAEIHDREPHHTLRVGDIALPQWIIVPDANKWRKHVLMTFTKDGG
eukprot:UN04509